MRTIPTILAGGIVCLFLAGCKTTTAEDVEWKDQLHNNLAVLGARNWIVVAESSFPSYAGAGVKTVVVDRPSDEVFAQVLDSLEMEGHVQPRIMIASELGKISEDYAPGIKRYKTRVAKLLPGRMHFELPNRIINGQVEDATKMFNVLVIKTATAIPYSNIYIELDSGYWSSESETALRSKLEGATQGTQGVLGTHGDQGTQANPPTQPTNQVQPLQGANPNPQQSTSQQTPPAGSAPSSSSTPPTVAPATSLDKLPALPKQAAPTATQPQPPAK